MSNINVWNDIKVAQKQHNQGQNKIDQTLFDT